MNIKKLEALIDALFEDRKFCNSKEDIDLINDKIIDYQIKYKKETGRYYHYSKVESKTRKI